MEEPIITFGSESLIIEMFPESIHKPMPEPLPEPLPETIIPLSEPVKKSWCVLS
jgi:hypothetical protein